MKTEEGNLRGRNASSTLRWHLHLFQDVAGRITMSQKEWTGPQVVGKLELSFRVLLFFVGNCEDEDISMDTLVINRS